MKKYSTDKFKGYNRVELRDFIHEYYRKNIQGKSVVNKDIGVLINFIKEGRKKTAKPLMSIYKAVVVYDIANILREQAKYNNFGKPKPKHIEKYGAIGFLNFKLNCVIDNKKRSFRIPVIITKNGKFQYDLHENGK